MLLLAVVTARADIYKCVDGDRTLYSDEPCGEQSQKIELLPPPDTTGQNKLSTDEMKTLSETLSQDRKIDSLNREIRDQRFLLEQLSANYESDRLQLEKALEEHLRGANSKIWYHHTYSQEAYRDRKRRLEEDIRQLYFEYWAERRLIQERLESLERTLSESK
ncbi:hypothetical protein BTA51_28325 [Hahella sp. CCB-MM4]|nr:hypothetical protein BTA51_28325 [Hahella sp. CCB-MM4]